MLLDHIFQRFPNVHRSGALTRHVPLRLTSIVYKIRILNIPQFFPTLSRPPGEGIQSEDELFDKVFEGTADNTDARFRYLGGWLGATNASATFSFRRSSGPQTVNENVGHGLHMCRQILRLVRSASPTEKNAMQ